MVYDGVASGYMRLYEAISCTPFVQNSGGVCLGCGSVQIVGQGCMFSVHETRSSVCDCNL